jgi:hypothetical protein
MSPFMGWKSRVAKRRKQSQSSTAPAQRVAVVTPEHVERLVIREFPEHYKELTHLLAEFRSTQFPVDEDRVRAAIIKMAAGDYEQIPELIGSAQRDSRDVLSAAEYPNYSKKTQRNSVRLSETEKRALYDADWRQYEEWFRKP